MTTQAEREAAGAGPEGGAPRGDLAFKEMCARFEVTPRTLRYYEFLELLSPRRVGRSRLYGPREVARMTLILRGRRFGFSLEEIRRWLLMREDEGTAEQMRVFAEQAERQLGALAERRAQIDETMDELRRLRELALQGPRPAGGDERTGRA